MFFFDSIDFFDFFGVRLPKVNIFKEKLECRILKDVVCFSQKLQKSFPLA